VDALASAGGLGRGAVADVCALTGPDKSNATTQTNAKIRMIVSPKYLRV
jgi:hypothetical protein